MYPQAAIQARSSARRALTETFAPIPCSMRARTFPTLPNPATRQRLPLMVAGYSRMAMSSAPSAVGTALRTANSSCV